MKYAETPDGQPTQKRIVPGQYKTLPNHVRTATGELHRFAEPEETPPLMEGWTRDFRRDLERSAYPLPLFLAESHWSFIHIHPFDDGNGRTARLLANYALLRNNLPPVVIKSEDRDRYIGGLQNADVGRILPLAEFMLKNAQWSIELAIRAAKGESIEEPGDIDKEIDLFVRRNRGNVADASNVEVLDNMFSLYVRPTLDKLENRLEHFARLFRVFGGTSFLEVGGHKDSSAGLLENRNWEEIKQKRLVTPGFQFSDENAIELRREFRFNDYTGSGSKGFDLILSIAWKLGGKGFSFEAAIDGNLLTAINRHIPYSELDGRDAEVDHTVEAICRCMMDEIDSRSQGPE